jgi:DNA polymerase-3 subunit epsilon
VTWHTEPMVGLDTETTGVDVETARIVTAALVFYSQDVEHVTRTWLSDVDGEEIPAEAIAVHGVATEQAHAEGQPAADVVDAVACYLVAALKQGQPLVAMNARFDFSVLDRELRRHGLHTLEQRIGRPVGPVIDPFVLDKQADKFRSGSRKLEALAAHYGVELSAAHTADADALAAVEVAVAIAEKFPELQVNPGQLHVWQIKWAADQAASFQTFKRRTDPTAVIDGAWPLVPHREAVHQPRRGDAVEQWLKARRDEHADKYGRVPAWWALDGLLDNYRLHADTGTPLGQHVCESRAVGDCDCLEQPTT